MDRTLLIVDDIKINREILKNILGDEYSVIEAADGREAMDILTRSYKQISLVLLDLSMPVMDGFEVLERMREFAGLEQVPVIIMTGSTDIGSEVRALQLGAHDYISKPYNPAVIRQRVKNTIYLRETAAAVNELRIDRLTGLLSRTAFLERAEEMVAEKEPGHFVMSCFNIENFKVINDQYGTATGDEVLRHVARCVDEYVSSVNGICCRVMADNFAMLIPAPCADSDELKNNHLRAISPPCIGRPINIRIGRYIVNDLTLSASAMYDRASLAETSIKGRYDRYVAFYDESMRDSLIRQQEIVGQMDGALKSGEFETWFQPQYNHTTGALIGAEALVRWRHPQKGLIPPGEFIPIFEQNGFVYELDKFVWEDTCRYLRKWTDEGRSPLPVSVNISRYDIFRADLIDVITGLVKKYGIPPELLRLEITESAFSVSSTQIVYIVTRLINCGFTVEIDDFGSGYSSLNTLKSVPAQVVKLDMRFLDDDNDSQRGGNILESIVRMTKWLGMSVLAEGVETKEQADFLKSIGCNYIQGYLYARPMPAKEYEEHSQGAVREEQLMAMETVENLDNNAFWEPKSMDTLIFNSYVGGACIFEYRDGNIEVLRANDKFARLFGESVTVDDVLKADWAAGLDKESYAAVINVVEQSRRSGEEISGEYVFNNIPGGRERTYLRSTMRVIAVAGERYLVYSTSENITAQRVAEQNQREVSKQLQVVMDNVNCGITAVVATGEHVEYLLANNRYYELLGYTKEQYVNEIDSNAFKTIHPEDRNRVSDVVRRTITTEKPAVMEYRVLRRDGSVAWLRSTVAMTRFDGVEEPVQLSTYSDVSAEKRAAQELLDNLPVGGALYEFDGEKITVLHLNKRYWQLVGREPVDYNESTTLDSAYPADRENILRELKSAIKEGRDFNCDFRVPYGEDEYRPFHVVGRIVPQKGGKYSIYAAYSLISTEEMSLRELLPVVLQAMMATQTEYSFVKDKKSRYICCSKPVSDLAGLPSEKDIAGKTDYDLFDKAVADRFVADDRRLLETGESIVDDVSELPTSSGGIGFVTTSKYPLYDSTGRIIGIYGTSRDITKARQTDSQLKMLTDSIPGGMAIYEGSPELLDKIRLVYFSDGFSRLFGFTREDYEKQSAKNPMGQAFEEDMPAIRSQIKALVRDNIPMDCVYRAHVRDGGYKWINLKAVIGDRRGENMTVYVVLFDVTARQISMEKLRMSEEENRLAIKHSGKIACRFDVASGVITVPPGSNPTFALPEKIENVPYGPVKSGAISPETADSYIAFYESIINGAESGSVVYQRKAEDGWRWLEAQFSTIFSDAQEPVSAVISFSDITEQLEKETVFKKWQQSLQDKDSQSYTLFRCNISKNAPFDSMEGDLLHVEYPENLQSLDQQIEVYARQCVFEEDQERYLAFLNTDSMLAAYYRGKRSDIIEYRENLPCGGNRWLRLTVDMVEYPNTTDVEAFLMYENVDDSKREALLTIQQAQTDPLTGVLNRSAFASQVEHLIRTARPHAQHALMMLDIDGFKMVNDAFGHAAGDQTLMDIAGSMQAILRKNDLVGRLGGDEFLVFLADIPNDSVAANKARQICAVTRKSFSAEVEISGSVGIAVSSRDGSDFETLYRKVDAALYHIKGAGKDSFAFYHEDMEGESKTPDETGDAPEGLMKKEKKRRLLIVDDNKIDYMLLANIFNEDYIIEKAKDGYSALVRMHHYGTSISAVLLDLMMPGIDGFDVMRKMQESAELRTIPVVVVSAAEDRETSLRAIRSGASDFITKPVDPELVRIRVSSAISKAENERLRAQNSILEYQNSEVMRYKTVLEREGVVVVENDWVSGTFVYDASISEHIAGEFDNRGLWHILLSDMVTDTFTVKAMQELVHGMAGDRKRMNEQLEINLKAPNGKMHRFDMNAYKLINEFGLTGRIILTFTDKGELP